MDQTTVLKRKDREFDGEDCSATQRAGPKRRCNLEKKRSMLKAKVSGLKSLFPQISSAANCPGPFAVAPTHPPAVASTLPDSPRPRCVMPNGNQTFCGEPDLLLALTAGSQKEETSEDRSRTAENRIPVASATSVPSLTGSPSPSSAQVPDEVHGAKRHVAAEAEANGESLNTHEVRIEDLMKNLSLGPPKVAGPPSMGSQLVYEFVGLQVLKPFSREVEMIDWDEEKEVKQEVKEDEKKEKDLESEPEPEQGSYRGAESDSGYDASSES